MSAVPGSVRSLVEAQLALGNFTSREIARCIDRKVERVAARLQAMSDAGAAKRVGYRNGRMLWAAGDGQAPEAPDVPSTKDCRDLVCVHFGFTTKQITGQSRKRALTCARQIGMYVAPRHSFGSLATITRCFKRDHSTVLHARQRISELRQTDAQIDHDCTQIETLISRMHESPDARAFIAEYAAIRGFAAWLTSPAWRPYRRQVRTTLFRAEERLGA